MRRSRVMLWLAMGLLGLAALVLVVDGLRWRLQVVALKVVGELPELDWPELARMVPPRGAFYLAPLLRTRNPHSTIAVPDSSPAAVARGGELFRVHCASCHGMAGEGGFAPALVEKSLAHARSDWALYRAISRGIPGTAMPGVKLAFLDSWKVAAYVKMLRREAARKSGGAVHPALQRLPAVTPDALVAARATPANWLTYSGAYDGWRYSPLAELNRGNVSRLRLLWLAQLPDSDPKLETTPLVVDGVMFLTTPGNGVWALDAATGTRLWTYEREQAAGLRLCCSRINRGLAILDSTLYLATQDAHLVALHARSGSVLWDVAVSERRLGYSFTSAPLALKDLVVIGNAGGEYATRGFIDAYDAATGRRRWRFQTIPAPGEPGHESWSGESWQTGGAPAWLTGSYDPGLDLLYWGVGNPNPDYNGDARAGDNLYSNSVVALEASTGRLRWHFQFTPHDLFDWDSAQIPILADVPTQSPAALLLWANRNGFYYVLDRATGRFLHAISFARQTWAERIDSTGRPVIRPGVAPSRTGSLVYPASATNWWSPSYSPRTGLVYVPTMEGGMVFFKGGAPEGSGALRLGSSFQPDAGGGRLLVRALDAVSGARRWEHEIFRAAPDHDLAVGGLLSTAGDLVFGGGSDRFLAFDARDGGLLWSFSTGGGVVAAPITYQVNGRQRVTIAAGRAILTFGLE